VGADAVISGGSDRLSRIQKLIREASTSAASLVLSTEEGDEMGRWPRNEWSETLAAVLDGDMVEAHEDAGVSDSKFWVTMLAKDGRKLKRKSFDVRTRTELAADDGIPLSVKLDGTQGAGNALQQNIMFANARLYINAMQSLLNSSKGIIELQNQLLRDTLSHERHARDEYHELRELLAEMREEQATLEPKDLTPAQQQFYALANKVADQLPMVAAGLKMAGKP
jgi:hypothetical protein